MDGILLGSVFPFISALCFAPRAASSYFSTATILSSNSCIPWGAALFLSPCASICVDGSFNYSTISSTSFSLTRNLCILVSISSMAFVICVMSCVFVDLVARLVFCSGWFVLSSAFVILSTKSATTPSRWTILPSYARFFSSYVLLLFNKLVIACSIS
jgi:hypothetical protein